VQRVYLACKNKLSNAPNYLKYGITFWQCASEVYGIDYSERIKALEWLASVQEAEKAQHEADALEELWASVKAHYRVYDDKKALLQMLNDVMVVVYTRDTADRWGKVFRAICGQSLDTVKEVHALVVEVAKCLYNIDVQSVEEVERLLGGADVELIKKIAELKAAGIYPWVKAPSWLISQTHRVVAGVPGVPDLRRKDDETKSNKVNVDEAKNDKNNNDKNNKDNKSKTGKTVYRYDLFPLFLKLIFAEHQEEPEGKDEFLTMSSENLCHTCHTGHTGGEYNTERDSAPNSEENTASSTSAELKETRRENSAEAKEGSAQDTLSNIPETGMTRMTRMTQNSPGHASSGDGALDTDGNPARQSGGKRKKTLKRDDILGSV